MKKVAIITINDYNNYGNRLQNYAAQEVLRSLDFQVETIVNNCDYITKARAKNKILYKLNKIMKMSNKRKFQLLQSIISNQINKKEKQKYKIKRINAFKEFTQSYIVEKKYDFVNYDMYKELSNEYEFFITGSDQVWNPHFRKGSPFDFLTFAPKEKRIAYAPSFGIDSIPVEYIDDYRIWLSEMENLSVREEAGAKIIKKLTGRDSEVLIDPTLMLSRDKWISISKESIYKPNKKYLLTYFLGKVSKDDMIRIRKIAIENKLEIVNLADLKDFNTYSADPSEFIDYISSSSLFFTDSFHGAVFSILLEKPFVIFDRIGSIQSMNSRIDTLLTKFSMDSRMWSKIKDTNCIFEVDYAHVTEILTAEREKAFNYLKKALKSK